MTVTNAINAKNYAEKLAFGITTNSADNEHTIEDDFYKIAMRQGVSIRRKKC